MNAQATLKLNGKDYGIRRMNYKFERDIDAKGRPCSRYYGGSIVVEIESTDDVSVFRNITAKDMPVSSGEILVTIGRDDLLLRRLTFSDAYVYAYAEQVDCHSGLPMITTISISPMKLDIGKNLSLNRRWPEADGWELMKPEEVKVVKKTTVNEKIIELTDAYWIDEKGKKHRDIPIGKPITLYVITNNYVIGKTINLDFDGPGYKKVSYSGVINKNGEIELKDFKLEYKSKL